MTYTAAPSAAHMFLLVIACALCGFLVAVAAAVAVQVRARVASHRDDLKTNCLAPSEDNDAVDICIDLHVDANPQEDTVSPQQEADKTPVDVDRVSPLSRQENDIKIPSPASTAVADRLDERCRDPEQQEERDAYVAELLQLRADLNERRLDLEVENAMMQNELAYLPVEARLLRRKLHEQRALDAVLQEEASKLESAVKEYAKRNEELQCAIDKERMARQICEDEAYLRACDDADFSDSDPSDHDNLDGDASVEHESSLDTSEVESFVGSDELDPEMEPELMVLSLPSMPLPCDRESKSSFEFELRPMSATV